MFKIRGLFVNYLGLIGRGRSKGVVFLVSSYRKLFYSLIRIEVSFARKDVGVCDATGSEGDSLNTVGSDYEVFNRYVRGCGAIIAEVMVVPRSVYKVEGI